MKAIDKRTKKKLRNKLYMESCVHNQVKAKRKNYCAVNMTECLLDKTKPFVNYVVDVLVVHFLSYKFLSCIFIPLSLSFCTGKSTNE